MAKKIEAVETEELEEVEVDGGDEQYPDMSQRSPEALLKIIADAQKALESSKSDRILKLHSKFDAEAKKEGFTLQQVFFKGATAKGKTYKVKYKDEATGKTWTGQGGFMNMPKWIKDSGKSPMEFALPECKADEQRKWDAYQAQLKGTPVPAVKAA